MFVGKGRKGSQILHTLVSLVLHTKAESFETTEDQVFGSMSSLNFAEKVLKSVCPCYRAFGLLSL